MIRDLFCLGCLLIMAASLVAGADGGGEKLALRVVTDRPEAVYQRGEEARFLISAHRGEEAVGVGAFRYTLTLDGGKVLAQGTGELAGETVAVPGTLTEPGVLRCTVVAEDGGQPVTALAAAAFDPSAIPPAAPEPDDFVSWWEEQKALVRAIPPDVQLTLDEGVSNERASYYRITIANIEGKRVHGWLGVPKRPGQFPAVLQVPAAGWNGISHGWVTVAEQGFLAMGIIIHDFDVDTTLEQAREYQEGALAGYFHMGRDSRETYYFRAAFLGCVRAMDYLCSRPEWDGQTLLVHGSSQGGGLAIVCAGLEPRVTAIAANVPALCDHLGFLAGRTPGWPRLVPGPEAAAAAVAPYYDAVNFARHARCESTVCLGLVDTTCPPSGVYAAFNQLPEPKRMVVTPLEGHVVSPEYNQALGELLSRLKPTENNAAGGG